MTTRLLILTLAGYLATGISGHANPAAAQAPAERAPVTVALVPELPRLEQVYDAVVIRTVAGMDLVLVTAESVNVDLLDAAVRVLLHSRASLGTPPTHFGAQHVREAVTLGVRRPEDSDRPRRVRLEGAAELVEALRSAVPRTVGSFGEVPALTFVPQLVRSNDA